MGWLALTLTSKANRTKWMLSNVSLLSWVYWCGHNLDSLQKMDFQVEDLDYLMQAVVRSQIVRFKYLCK